MPIAEYAVLGDGRTTALVARGGAVEWLCLPDLDSPSVLGRLLDAEHGGAFTLAPVPRADVVRRYLPGTNVLETTFHTDVGIVRVTDALTLSRPGLAPHRELARRVEGLSGRVPMTWALEPRFGYGQWTTRVGRRRGVPVATSHTEALAVQSWGAGKPSLRDTGIDGSFQAREGTRALLSLGSAHQEPLVLSDRDAVESRLDATATAWRRWTDRGSYDGPWRDAVDRSALVLKMLISAPTGAIAAAATTSLPEVLGGRRNWDYRFCWIRDAAYTLEALLDLGHHDEAHAFAWWFLQATQLTHPDLHVLYRLDGGPRAVEVTLPWTGYRGSRPVRVGNAAVDQLQLDIYGALLETFWIYASRGHPLDPDAAQRLAEVADRVCHIWRQPDCGIWEVRQEPRHFTQSKLMCWVALDRASRLAERGLIPGRTQDAWRRERDALRAFIENECWSDSQGAYARSAGSEDLDASVLLMARLGYDDPLLMGTVFTSDRRRAKLLGYALHFLVGLVFAVAYGLVLVALGRGGWLWGAAVGVLHSLFLGTVGVNVLLPAVHPRMGGEDTSFETSPLLEPPGILMLNYGRSTPLVSLVAHAAYGALIGGLGVS